MSSQSEKMVSETEAVRRERAAVDKAVGWLFSAARRDGGIEHVDARNLANHFYPWPKITRPRLVVDPEGVEFKSDGPIDGADEKMEAK